MHKLGEEKKGRKRVKGSASRAGKGFTWLQAGLLHGGLGSGDGYPSVLQVGLGNAALALAPRRPVRTELAF